MIPSAQFAVVPYLKTSGRVVYRGITFRASSDVDGLTPEEQEHVKSLTAMFFLRDNLQIQATTFAVVPAASADQIRDNARKLAEFQALIAYLYSALHPDLLTPFLTRHHGNLYVFTPQQVTKFLLWNDTNVTPVGSHPYAEPDDRDEVRGYHGILDGRRHVWVAPGSRLYPPVPQLSLNISQDLQKNLEQSSNPLFADRFARPYDCGDLDERIFIALQWYNLTIDNSFDPNEELAHLAIALETLLDLDQGKAVTERFAEAVMLLLGRAPQLENWLKQFYDARSDVMHKGRSARALFDLTEPKGKAKSEPDETQQPYRSLVSYGRRIFQLCLSTIATGTMLARQYGLSSLFVPNQRRFTEICCTADDRKDDPAKALGLIGTITAEIERFQFVSDPTIKIETMLGAARRVVSLYLATCDPGAEPCEKQLKSFVTSTDSPDCFDALSILGDLKDCFRARHSDAAFKSQAVVASLLHSVWMYTFEKYFRLQRQRADANATKPPST